LSAEWLNDRRVARFAAPGGHPQTLDKIERWQLSMEQ
jgi:hypothetical protein